MITKDYYDLVDWFDIRRNTKNAILVVDIEANHKQHVDISEKFNNEDLLKVDKFFTYSINEHSAVGSVMENEIVDRYIDELGNLILFVRSNLTQVRS
jgi:hypothetical protein